jgi:TolB-like protein/Flp pilus assembly protein TadD
LSPDQGNEFLSDGLADDIAHALTRFAGLRVVAGASARTFRGKDLDLREVGSKLNVAHVLEGNLRKSGDRFRLTVQLYRVSDRSLLWGRGYDREMAGVFAVQDNVARNIASELGVKPSDDRAALRRHTQNTEAYQLYLKGRYYHQRQTAEALLRSKECFDQAIALDPKYALAYYGLAEYYWSQCFYASVPPRDLLISGKAAAVKALELDDTLAEPHAMLGIFRALLDFDWPRAEQEFHRALELDPGSAISRDRRATYLLPALGRPEEAVAEMNQVVESDPLSVYYQYHLALVLIHARQPDRAIEVCRKALALDPNSWLPHWALGHAYAMKEQFPEAIQALERAGQLRGQDALVSSWLSAAYASAGRRAEAQQHFRQLQEASRGRHLLSLPAAAFYLGMGDRENSLALLARAVDDREPYVFWLPAMPGFDPPRSDPRFQALLRKMNLPP